MYWGSICALQERSLFYHCNSYPFSFLVFMSPAYSPGSADTEKPQRCAAAMRRVLGQIIVSCIGLLLLFRLFQAKCYQMCAFPSPGPSSILPTNSCARLNRVSCGAQKPPG